MIADFHVHSEFSDDSSEPMENQILRAEELGLTGICFTDHVDYGIKRDWNDPAGIAYRPADPHNNVPGSEEPLANVDYPEYFDMLACMQKKNAGRIRIACGLEFGMQTETVDAFQKLYNRYKNRLDFVLLSMHQVNNLEFWTQDFQKGKSQKEYNDEYYLEIYKVQQVFHDYSALAHLDLLCRYDPAGIYPFEKEEEIIAAILKTAINDGKGIEINTSSWHYGLKDTQPSRKILSLYKDLGGTIITMGSDAHSIKYVGDHFQDAVSILKDEIGFREYCTFEKMKPVFHEL